MFMLGSMPGSVLNFHVIWGQITYTSWVLVCLFVNLGHWIKSSLRTLPVPTTHISELDPNQFPLPILSYL